VNILKAIVAAVGSLVTVATGVLADDVIGMDEWGALVSALVAAGATVYAVWRAPNRPAAE
jgi:F0F1-type ATP synthase assembly protein I